MFPAVQTVCDFARPVGMSQSELVGDVFETYSTVIVVGLSWAAECELQVCEKRILFVSVTAR